MVSILGRIRAFYASMLAGTTRRDTDERDTGQPRQGLYLERRYETRLASIKPCQFSLVHSLNLDSVVFQEWTGVIVNQSMSGMLLQAGSALPHGKLLEVVTDEAWLHPSVSVVEVQWSKPVPKTSEGQLHLVGCRKTFPPKSSHRPGSGASRRLTEDGWAAG